MSDTDVLFTSAMITAQNRQLRQTYVRVLAEHAELYSLKKKWMSDIDQRKLNSMVIGSGTTK
jgi:hypothetical protein